MSWIPIPKDLAPILGKIKDFSAASAITPFRILIFQIDKLLPRVGYDEKGWKNGLRLGNYEVISLSKFGGNRM